MIRPIFSPRPSRAVAAELIAELSSAGPERLDQAVDVVERLLQLEGALARVGRDRGARPQRRAGRSAVDDEVDVRRAEDGRRAGSGPRRCRAPRPCESSGIVMLTRTLPSSPRAMSVTRPTMTPAILTSEPGRSEPPALRTWADDLGVAAERAGRPEVGDGQEQDDHHEHVASPRRARSIAAQLRARAVAGEAKQCHGLSRDPEAGVAAPEDQGEHHVEHDDGHDAGADRGAGGLADGLRTAGRP